MLLQKIVFHIVPQFHAKNRMGAIFFVKGLLFCVVRCHMTTALLVFFRPPMADGMGGHY